MRMRIDCRCTDAHPRAPDIASKAKRVTKRRPYSIRASQERGTSIEFAHGLRDGLVDDLRCCLDLTYEVDAFACPHDARRKVIDWCREVSRFDFRATVAQAILVRMPTS